MTATFKVCMDVSLPCSVSFCIRIIILYFCGEINKFSSSSYHVSDTFITCPHVYTSD